MYDGLVRRFARIAAIAVALLTVSAIPARSQGSGTITGVVMDASARVPIPQAQIQIVGTTRGTVAGDSATRVRRKR